MREIKFRAWDKEEKTMLYRTIFDRNWYATPKNDELGCHCIQGILPEDRSTMELMQFTGLKDKNGKEIYEGDIVKVLYPCRLWHGEFVASIDFDCLIGSYIFKTAGGTNESWNYRVPKTVEIIGNIYENPELLK